METLKRDWDSKLTLRDVLVTISCLLIQPNPDSALNADAGALIQQSYEAFARRAQLMTSIHAGVPPHLRDAVIEARTRGQGSEDVQEEEEQIDRIDLAEEPAPGPKEPIRRRRTIARQRRIMAPRRSDGSPSRGPAERRRQLEPTEPFVRQTASDDVFGLSPPTSEQEPRKPVHSDESMEDADQENDESLSPVKTHTPKVASPIRPPGAPVPLGELSLEDISDESEDMEPEYPPSPRKSPTKSPLKKSARRLFDTPELTRPESSRAALLRYCNTTPPNATENPLVEDSPFARSVQASPEEKVQRDSRSSPKAKGKIIDPFGRSAPVRQGRIVKTEQSWSAEAQWKERSRMKGTYEALWRLCGEDVKRWNRCDFDGQPIAMVAARW